MILTNRELFLLIICTVFYITLFIVVLQSNRLYRKVFGTKGTTKDWDDFVLSI